MGLLVYDVTMRMKASYRLCWLYAISSTAISLIFSMSRFPDGFTGIESKTLNVTGTHSESRFLPCCKEAQRWDSSIS